MRGRRNPQSTQEGSKATIVDFEPGVQAVVSHNETASLKVR